MPEIDPQNLDIVGVSIDLEDRKLREELADLTTQMFGVSGAKNWVAFEITHEVYGPMEISIQKKNGLTPADQLIDLRERMRASIAGCVTRQDYQEDPRCKHCDVLQDLLKF